MFVAEVPLRSQLEMEPQDAPSGIEVLDPMSNGMLVYILPNSCSIMNLWIQSWEMRVAYPCYLPVLASVTCTRDQALIVGHVLQGVRKKRMLSAEWMTKDNDDDDFGEIPMEPQGARSGRRNDGDDHNEKEEDEEEEDDDEDDDDDDDDDALKRMGLSKEERYVRTYETRTCSASLAES